MLFQLLYLLLILVFSAFIARQLCHQRLLAAGQFAVLSLQLRHLRLEIALITFHLLDTGQQFQLLRGCNPGSRRQY